MIVILLGLYLQSDFNSAISDFHGHRYDKALTKFEQFLQLKPHDPKIPAVLYYLGLLQPKPQAAKIYYQRVIDGYPQTEWAALSLLNRAKIDYALNDYLEAVSGLNRFIKDYPESEDMPEACYWLGTSYLALHDTVSAEKFLTELITKFPRNPWAIRAGIKVVGKKAIPETVVTKSSSIPSTIPIPQKLPKLFTIQVGSFQSKNNALALVSKLKKLGYDGEIHEAVVAEQIYYRVRVGSFSDSNDAAPVLQSLKANGINGQIVKR